jgi:Fes/CIP4, and EFC/F-BAR homology domain
MRSVKELLQRCGCPDWFNATLLTTILVRAAIEDEYARKLLGLARKPLGGGESGSIRMSLDVIRREVESMGKAHQNIANQMKTELEEPLTAFAGAMKERRKIVQGGIEKLLKLKIQQTTAANKVYILYVIILFLLC